MLMLCFSYGVTGVSGGFCLVLVRFWQPQAGSYVELAPSSKVSKTLNSAGSHEVCYLGMAPSPVTGLLH